MAETTFTKPQGASGMIREQFPRVSLLVGILCAFALRIVHLGADSLWYDETVSTFLAQKSIAAILAHTAGDIHPPGYYLMLHLWQWLTTASLARPFAPGLEFLFAWPSLCFGMLIVGLIYPLGKRFFGRWRALLALWLAAIHPFQIWYSQEVRMYTLGAFLGLLALWATVHYWGAGNSSENEASREASDSPHLRAYLRPTAGWRWPRRWPRRWGLVLYIVCGAIGLYTLYYSLFLLLSLNLVAALLCCQLEQQSTHNRRRLLMEWLIAQCCIVLLWLPWLPIFWHQATEPPVPPWRAPWPRAADIIAALSESMSAILSGQSAPMPTHWLWLVGGLSVIAAGFTYTEQRDGIDQQLGRENRGRQAQRIILLYLFVPVGLLFITTLVATPLYHVRYVMLYAPIFVLWVAATLEGMYKRHQWATIMLAMLLLFINGWSLVSFWHAPQYKSDDHRGAVHQLATEWRPGDLILVNAGWVYTALETYWPTTLVGVEAAIPPPLHTVTRLSDYASQIEQSEQLLSGAIREPSTEPIIVRTGSVDGSPSLGWGDPASDFFAMESNATLAALELIAQTHPRIWHYRLYDTVNDPNGLIRDWLATHGALARDESIRGRDYLRLQLFEFPKSQVNREGGAEGSAVPHREFDLDRSSSMEGEGRGELHLLQAQPFSTTVAAGNRLYLQSRWQYLGAHPATLSTVSVSLRLYDIRGLQVAQQDVTPWYDVERFHHFGVNQSSRPVGTDLPLALPIPVATQPGLYNLRLLLYDQTTGEPFVGDDGDPQLTLADITIEAAEQAPLLDNELVTFDYIDLLTLRMGQQMVSRGATIAIETNWRPQPNSYRDTYLLQWSLLDQAESSVQHPVQQWEEPLGSWEYPSSVWPATFPVRQLSRLALEPTIGAGTYQLALHLVRQSDGAQIAPHRSWWQWLPDKRTFAIRERTLFVAEITIAE